MKRRNFIKYSATGVSSLILPNIIIPNRKKSIGVALVGLGYYSTDLLAPALQLTKHCHLAGVVTGSPEKAKAWQQKYKLKDKNIYDYTTMHTIANNPDIDVVYIVVPNALHLKYVEIAANAGKHVWCEKPLALNALEGQKIIDLCKKNKVKLSIGYRMQHEPNTRTIMGWAKTKPFGNIKNLTAKAGWRGNGGEHWKFRKKLGGGAMYDMGTYSLNAARYTLGEDPIAVTAKHVIARPELFFEVDETTEFNLEFPSGAVANCVTSIGQNINELHVDCEKGTYGLTPFQSYTGVKGEASDGTLLHTYIENQQTRQMDDDAWAIMNNLDLMVPGEDGLTDMYVVDAIFESAANSGKRVTISY